MNLAKVLTLCPVDQHLTEMELVSLPVNVNLKEGHPRVVVLQGKYIFDTLNKFKIINVSFSFGVCCVFVINDSSSTTISQNDTYIQNPGYPSQYGETNTLSYTINKCSDDICWLRLDFETFNTVAPTDTTEGDVATPKSYACNDPMTITTTSGQSIPDLCGDLTGQHSMNFIKNH